MLDRSRAYRYVLEDYVFYCSTLKALDDVHTNQLHVTRPAGRVTGALTE